MTTHAVKTERQIEEEIRRRAQGAAKAAGDTVIIPTPSIVSTAEPTLYGSHWIIMNISASGVGYVETAAVQVSKIWDVRRS